MPGVTRRTFVRSSGAAASGAALAACTSSDSPDTPEPEPVDPTDWQAIRGQFPLDPKLRHFAAFVLAAHPKPVAAAIEKHRRALDKDTESYLATSGNLEAGVRKAAAAYLGAQPLEVALTDSTTMGLGLLYGGLDLKPGQEVLTTEHDFLSTHESLRLRAAATGAKVSKVKLYDDPAAASAGDIVDRLLAGVKPATRAVAVTWVHSSTGVRLPIAEIAAALKPVNAERGPKNQVLLCVDGVHGFGAVDAGVEELGCDFLVSGTHKWLFGPRGTGIVWGRREAWPAVRATIPPFEAATFTGWLNGTAPVGLQPGPGATPGGYHSFEHRWALKEAFDFHQRIGRAAVAARITELATRLKDGLAEIDGLQLITPKDPELSAGVVCVTVDGREPFEFLGQLRDQKIIASTTPYNPAYLRFGTSMAVLEDDVDELVKAMTKLA